MVFTALVGGVPVQQYGRLPCQDGAYRGGGRVQFHPPRQREQGRRTSVGQREAESAAALVQQVDPCRHGVQPAPGRAGGTVEGVAEVRSARVHGPVPPLIRCCAAARHETAPSSEVLVVGCRRPVVERCSAVFRR